MKFVKYILIGIAVFLVASLVQNISRMNLAMSRISQAKQELSASEKKNEDLKNSLQISDSSEFVEGQARDKLGLAKIGETVIVLPQADVLRKLAPVRVETKINLPDPNWKKWLKLFI